jgi:hypothetical protein
MEQGTRRPVENEKLDRSDTLPPRNVGGQNQRRLDGRLVELLLVLDEAEAAEDEARKWQSGMNTAFGVAILLFALSSGIVAYGMARTAPTTPTVTK